MFEVIAGEAGGETYESSTWIETLEPSEAPEHVNVLEAGQVDTSRYAEGELTDAELLDLAVEDAVDAVVAGRVSGPVLDEVELRRALRRARRAETARAQRTKGAVA